MTMSVGDKVYAYIPECYFFTIIWESNLSCNVCRSISYRIIITTSYYWQDTWDDYIENGDDTIVRNKLDVLIGAMINAAWEPNCY